MSPDQEPVDLASAVSGLVRPFPAEQDRLDREFAGRFLAWVPIFQAARAAGMEELARTVAPSAMAIGDAEIQLSFAISRSTASETDIRIRAINAGYQRRFEATQSVHHRITIKLQRSPLSPNGSEALLSGAGSPP
jgi:hypothetical protein